jgi:hypothetical protein
VGLQISSPETPIKMIMRKLAKRLRGLLGILFAIEESNAFSVFEIGP